LTENITIGAKTLRFKQISGSLSSRVPGTTFFVTFFGYSKKLAENNGSSILR